MNSLWGLVLWPIGILGFSIWYLSVHAAGENLNPRGNHLPWWQINIGILVGAASAPAICTGLYYFDGSPVPFERAMTKIAGLYLVFATFAAIGGFRVTRLWILLGHGREALRRHDVRTPSRFMSDTEWLELQHGKLGEEIRMKRYLADLASQEKSGTKEKGTP